MRGMKHILLDSAFGCAHQIPLLTEDSVAMTPRAVEWRFQMVKGRLLPLMEPMPGVSAVQAMEIERESGSV